MMRCPNCDHVWTAAKRQAAEMPDIDPATMSTKALYTYYKRTAPREDCAFVVRLHPELSALVPAVPTQADAKRIFEAARRIGEAEPNEAAFWYRVATMPQAWRNGTPMSDIENQRRAYVDATNEED
jgi:hypothetical protein